MFSSGIFLAEPTCPVVLSGLSSKSEARSLKIVDGSSKSVDG